MMPGKLDKPGAGKFVRDIRLTTRRRQSAEEKIRLVPGPCEVRTVLLNRAAVKDSIPVSSSAGTRSL